MTADDPLADLAGAVADGGPVEWDAERASVARDDLDTVAELKILAEIARLHRAAHGVAPEDTRLPPRPVEPGELFRWGPLSVRERIGGGSFGEVYRAWDPSLEREVALKLFRAGAASADVLAREGQLLARIRHQNVIAVYGAQQDGSQVGMWTELLCGRTLADVVKKDGPLSAAETAIYVESVCRALAAVHKAGLLHRDIKAQNVMRETGGRIVLMDLGLGREAGQHLAPSFDLAGTPLYLAPELFSGGSATVRSDVYSVGVLLFFLVTGQYPVTAAGMSELAEAHRGGTRRRLIDVRPDLPVPFVHVVERALRPDSQERFESAGALQQALSAITSDGQEARVGPLKRRWSSIAASVAVAAMLGLGAGLVLHRAGAAPPADPITFTMPTPEGLVLTEGDRNVPVISPDGRQIAFVGTDRLHGGVSRLYVWSLSKPTPRAIAGSENAANPFWAPDSQSLAFVTARGSALYRVSVSGARSERLADLWESRGGAWGPDGSLLIARQTSEIYRLDGSGGHPKPVTKLADGEIAHMWPQFLPDGQHFIFFVQGRDDRTQGIYLGSIDGALHKKLVFADASAIYANGYVVFPSSGALFARRLDRDAGALTGQTIQLLARIDTTTAMRTIVSASENGTLVYADGKDVRRLTWYDLHGNVTGTGETARLKNPAVSRDRPLLALEWYGEWQTDATSPAVSRGRELRVLSMPDYRTITKIGGAGATCPVWGPDGQLAFVDVESGQHLDVYVVNVLANTPPRLLVTSDADKETTDWSRDGRLIAYHELRQSATGKVYRQLLIKPLDGAPYPAVSLPDGVSAHTGTFSPSARYIAYLSDQEGGVDWEIYVRDLRTGVVRQVTRHGGYNPVWRTDGQLLFLDPTGRLYQATIPASPSAPMPEPALLFSTQVSTPRTSLRYFDLLPDSQQIVVASPLPSAFSVLMNWPAEVPQEH